MKGMTGTGTAVEKGGASPHRHLLNAAAIVMSSMVFSRITGYLRDNLITNSFTAKNSDIFYYSFRITDIMFNLLVGGSIAAALIPVLSGYLVKGREEEGWKAVSTFINIILISMIAVSSMGMVFSTQIVDILAPWYKPAEKALMVKVVRVLFPSVSFLMMTGIVNGIMNSYKRFAAAAFGPTLYNIGTVLSLLFLRKRGIQASAAGIMASAFFYFLIQLAFAMRNMKHYRPVILFHHKGFIRLFTLALPSLAASSIVQINTIINYHYTSLYPKGAITAYTNAFNVWQLPYGIFAMGMGMAFLPTLSEKIALKDMKSFKDILLKGIKSVMFLVIPSAAGFIALSGPIISCIYKWARVLTPERISLTGSMLVIFTLGLLAQSLLAMVTRAFFALNDTKTPLYQGMVSIVLNYAFCLAFRQLTHLEAKGMAFSYSISSVIYAVIMIMILIRRLNIPARNTNQSGHKKKNGSYGNAALMFKMIFASAAMALLLHIMYLLMPLDFNQPYRLASKMLEVVYLAAVIGLGSVVYFTVSLALGIDEAARIYNIAAKKLGLPEKAR